VSRRQHGANVGCQLVSFKQKIRACQFSPNQFDSAVKKWIIGLARDIVSCAMAWRMPRRAGKSQSSDAATAGLTFQTHPEPMDRRARQIRRERDEAYQRLQLAYQEMQVAREVIKKYSAGAALRDSKAPSGEAIYRRALDAWDAATRDFTEASREFMSATEQLSAMGLA
jgi:hypothetical protein